MQVIYQMADTKSLKKYIKMNLFIKSHLGNRKLDF